MYFTETEALRELEILMQMIPGFQPKGYGSMVMPDQIYIYLQEPPPPTYQEMIADKAPDVPPHEIRIRRFWIIIWCHHHRNAVNFTPFSVLTMLWMISWWSRMVLVIYSPRPLPPLFRFRDLSTR